MLSLCVAQTHFKCRIILPRPPLCWGYRLHCAIHAINFQLYLLVIVIYIKMVILSLDSDTC